MNAIRLRSPVTKPLLAFGTPKPAPPDPRAHDTFRVTSPFALRGTVFHGANDMGDYGSGAAVVAVADGKVIAAGNLKMPWSQPTNLWASGNYGGLMCVLEIAPRVVAIYAHFGSLAVKVGQQVASGQKLGAVGDTGSAQGAPHLHFALQAPAELVPAGVKTNPTIFGYGLDVDPWPFISGAAVLGEDDDMKYASGNRPFFLADIAPGTNLRSAPALHPETLALFLDPAKHSKPIQVGVWSFSLGDEWQGSTTWAFIGWDGRGWYVHAKLLSNLRPTPALPVQPVEHGIPAAIADALDVQLQNVVGAVGKARDTVAAGRVE